MSNYEAYYEEYYEACYEVLYMVDPLMIAREDEPNTLHHDRAEEFFGRVDEGSAWVLPHDQARVEHRRRHESRLYIVSSASK